MGSFPETFNDQNLIAQNVGLGEGYVDSFPETFNDLKGLYVYQTAD